MEHFGTPGAPQGPPKDAQGTPKGSILEHFSNTFAPQSSFWVTFKQRQKHQQKQQQKRQELSNDKQQKQRQQHQQQQQQKQQQREHQHQRVHFEMLCSNNTCTDHPGSIQSGNYERFPFYLAQVLDQGVGPKWHQNNLKSDIKNIKNHQNGSKNRLSFCVTFKVHFVSKMVPK